MNFGQVRGTRDLLGDEYYLQRSVLQKLEHHFLSYGYQGVALPILERTQTYLWKSGQSSRRKLFTLKAGDNPDPQEDLCLRPEITVSLLRAIQPLLPTALFPIRMAYQGPVFRNQGMAVNTDSQFTQAGVELIGAGGAWADAEVVQVAYRGLESLGLTDHRIILGSLGTVIEMARLWIEERKLRDFLVENFSNLGKEIQSIAEIEQRLAELGFAVDSAPQEETSQEEQELATILNRLGPEEGASLLAGLLKVLNLEVGPNRNFQDMMKRIVNKSNRHIQRDQLSQFLQAATELSTLHGPAYSTLSKLDEFIQRYQLSKEPLIELQQTLDLLIKSGIPQAQITVDLGFGRGLHYYSGLIFEIQHRGRPLCGGGRYDGLSKIFGETSAPMPLVGFSYGIERVCEALTETGLTEKSDDAPGNRIDALVVPATEEDYGTAISEAQKLRAENKRVELATAPLSEGEALGVARKRQVAQLVFIQGTHVHSQKTV
jgi:histidyl-tRNA synthetase